MSELIEEEPKSRFAKLRQRMREKKVRRKAEKAEMKRIEKQEMASLQRRFIRKKVRMKLAKKFTPQQFRLEQAQKKRSLQKLARPVTGDGRPAGERILEGLGGFGLKPVIPKPKPKKKKRQQFVLMRI